MTQTRSLILKPSLVHGVGVFTTRRIRQGATLPLFPVRDWRIVRTAPRSHSRWRFLQARPGGGYYAPRDVHRMCIGWYLNHSTAPNVDASTWRALRDIDIDCELLIDYRIWGDAP